MEEKKIFEFEVKSFLSIFSMITGISSAAHAVSGDPALNPQPAAAAASAAMEAASPTTPGASAPAAAASFAASAASAASAPSVSPPASAAVSVPANQTPAIPAPPIERAALSTSEFYGFSDAIRDLKGFIIGTDLSLRPIEEIWPTSTKTKSLQTFTSADEKMHLDFGRRSDGGYEVITTSEAFNRAMITVFKNKKPVSETIVGPYGSYTATEAFCNVLKEQTKSTDFKDLAAKAATCSAFYARTDSSKLGMAEHIQIHRTNIERMENSPAKPFVDRDRASVIASARDKLTGLRSLKAKFSAEYGVPSVKPRAIINKSTSPEDVKDRQAIFDLADACGRLWGGDSGTSTPPRAGTKRAATSGTKK